jgi:transcriptional regulator with XRE-family HTH domain
MRNIVGQRVKIARHRFEPRLTQVDLAGRLQLKSWDIDRSGIAKIEIGLREVTDIEVLKLAEALQVSASWLLGEGE